MFKILIKKKKKKKKEYYDINVHTKKKIKKQSTKK